MKFKLRELRKERGWSQQEVAVNAGLSIDCIRSIEVGRAFPSIKTAFQLKKAFGFNCIDEMIDDVV